MFQQNSLIEWQFTVELLTPHFLVEFMNQDEAVNLFKAFAENGSVNSSLDARPC